MIGDLIREKRAEAGLTQEQLAEKVYVSPQAVSQWELGKTIPDTDKLQLIAKVLKVSHKQLLGLTAEGTDTLVVLDKMFQEEHMYSRIKVFAETEHLTETYRALPYMREQHEGQYRKPGQLAGNDKVPYIQHPLMMACHAHALGIRDDDLLATILLHDVCEDCGVEPKDLPFNEQIREAVAALTKRKEEGQTTEEYYEGIRVNKIASMVKVIDRCSNVSTMAASFDDEKLAEYINETETYVYPLLEYIKKEYPEYSDVLFVIRYQIVSLVETTKNLILR